MVHNLRLAILAATLSRPCGAVLSCGTCVDTDGSSLLQTILTHNPARSPQFTDIVALLEKVRRVANSQKRDSQTTMTPEEASIAIGTAQDVLTSLLPTFAEQQAAAQHEVDTQFDEMQGCHNRADMAHHEETVTSHHTAKIQCDEALANAVATQSQECTAWTSQAESLYDGLPDCGHPSSPGELFNIVDGWANLVEGEWASIRLQRSRCQEAREVATDRSQMCATMTDAYVEAFCGHSFACRLAADCHVHEIEVYNSLRLDVEAQMIAWQQQYRTVRQATCITDLIMTSLRTSTPIDDDSLTTCDNVIVDDLAVTFRDPPQAPDECQAPQSDGPHCDAPFGLRHSSWGEFVNVDDFQNHITAWVDREYIYNDLPEELLGTTLFSGPCKRLSSGELTFHTNHRAMLYVFSEENNRHGGFASLGWERVGTFDWTSEGTSAVSSCPGCAGNIGCWKREVNALEDVVIPVSTTWVGGVAARLAH